MKNTTVLSPLPETLTTVLHTSLSTDRKNGILTGLFFIAATTFAIIGLILYQPILAETDYLRQGAAHANQIKWGAISELILAAANCGTAIMLFPYLSAYNKSVGIAYFCFRVVESILILLGVVSVLTLLTLSQAYIQTEGADPGTYETTGIALRAVYQWTFLLGPKFMLGINTFIYSYTFFKTGLVPKRLALLGITGAVLVFIVAHLEMFDLMQPFTASNMIMVFPIAIYEMILAGWLIAKGFSNKE